MITTPQLCAHEVIDVMPEVVQALRAIMRSQRQNDLSVPQFRTLAFLSRHPGSSLSTLAEHIGLTRPSMSVLVDGLVARGLLVRATDLDDRRKVALTLTPTGEALYAAAHDQAETWMADRLDQLDAAELAVITQVMRKLRHLLVTDTTARQVAKG